jgi:hypothetical protein
MFRFIHSYLDADNVSKILRTYVYVDFLSAYRACFRDIDRENDKYCSKLLSAVQDDITNGEKLIQVSHNLVDENLYVCWIQVIERGDEPLLPLEMKTPCCVWPKKD